MRAVHDYLTLKAKTLTLVILVDLGEDLIAYEISDTEPNEGDIFSKDVDSIIADEVRFVN